MRDCFTAAAADDGLWRRQSKERRDYVKLWEKKTLLFGLFFARLLISSTPTPTLPAVVWHPETYNELSKQMATLSLTL